MQRIHFRHTWDRISANYWFFPLVMLVLGICLAGIMLRVDARLPNTAQRPWFFYTGTASEARTALIALAATILGTASVVYSLLTVPLSVAASQFGSRLLRLYLRDRTTQFILGLFVGTFVYLLSVALGIPSEQANPETPQVSASLGLLLCLITFGSIIVLVHHIGTSLQAPNMVASAGKDLLQGVELSNSEYRIQSEIDPRLNGKPIPSMVEQAGSPIYSNRQGYIQYIDPDRVLPLAEGNDLTIHLIRKAGDFIQNGDLIAYAYPKEKMNPGIATEMCRAYKLGNQRTPAQDLVYAVNQLVEVAVRAMSPAINDPFTALTCLDHIGAGLSSYEDKIKSRAFLYYDSSGNLRLIFDPVTSKELFEAAFNMIRHASRDNADVLMGILKTIETIANRMTRPETRSELLHHVRLVETECQSGSAIDWDKKRISQKCAELISSLEMMPVPEAEAVIDR